MIPILKVRDKDGNVRTISVVAAPRVLSPHAESHKPTGKDPITPESIGAADKNHTHTAADVGASPVGHKHTAADVEAAEKDHTHTAEDIGAATTDTYYAAILDNWIDGEGYFYQTIAISGICEDDNPIVDICAVDVEAGILYSKEMCKVFRISTWDGVIHVYATEPTNVAIPIQLKVVR